MYMVRSSRRVTLRSPDLQIFVYSPASGSGPSETRRQIFQQEHEPIPAGRQSYRCTEYRMLGERKECALLVISDGINHPVDLLPLFYALRSLAGQLSELAFQVFDGFAFG